MIYKKGDMWKISGYPQKYATLEDAEKFLGKKEKPVPPSTAHEEKLQMLREESTPYEVMIEKNVCLICNLEPCECFTYTRRTEAGL